MKKHNTIREDLKPEPRSRFEFSSIEKSTGFGFFMSIADHPAQWFQRGLVKFINATTFTVPTWYAIEKGLIDELEYSDQNSFKKWQTEYSDARLRKTLVNG